MPTFLLPQLFLENRRFPFDCPGIRLFPAHLTVPFCHTVTRPECAMTHPVEKYRIQKHRERSTSAPASPRLFSTLHGQQQPDQPQSRAEQKLDGGQRDAENRKNLPPVLLQKPANSQSQRQYLGKRSISPITALNTSFSFPCSSRTRLTCPVNRNIPAVSTPIASVRIKEAPPNPA